MVSDQEMGKKMVEREELYQFLEAYEQATGEKFPKMCCSETPDFVGEDENGRSVGIELTQLKFSPDHMFVRRYIEKQDWVSDEDAFWRILELLAKKDTKLKNGNWPQCERKILVIQLVDYPLSELLPNCTTDKPHDQSFSEIWFADYTITDMYGGVDLFPIVHPNLEGYFPVASENKKPYG